MIKTGNRWYAPFSWGDISTLTGVGGPPYAMGNMVANSSMLNKFSKIKPVIHPGVGILAESDFKSTGWGFGTSGIPSYANWSALRSALGAITPGNVWQYQKPTGTNWYRSHDFNGYVAQSDSWAGMGIQNNVNLLFPFNGIITIPSTEVGPYDVLKFANMDPVAADGSDDGLLYLNDFAGMTAYSPSYYNYTDWYFGVLLVGQGSNPSAAYLVNTLETIKHFADNDSYPELGGIPFQVGSAGASVPSGTYYLYPVINSICVSTLRNFVQITSGWSGESNGPGRMVLLDGYRLPVTVNASKVGLSFAATVNVSGSTTTITMTLTNNSGVSATVGADQMFIYVTSDGVQNGEYSDFEAVMNALQTWRDSGTRYSSGITNNSRTVARYINVYSTFYSRNGSSNVLAAGRSVTFTATINSATDPLGNPYDQYTEVDLCFGANMNGVFERKTL